MALYKANDKIIMLECKMEEKSEKYARLYQQFHYYKKQYEKLRSENNDESNQNVMYHFFFMTLSLSFLLIMFQLNFLE